MANNLLQYKHLPIKSASFQREIEEIYKNTWQHQNKKTETKEKGIENWGWNKGWNEVSVLYYV